MTFAEKLDLLMNVTNTTNSMLARSISMDASFISRLRKGVRTPARNAGYIQVMVEYFTRRCPAEYQKATLWEAMKSSFKGQPPEANNMKELLYKWLREENEARPDMINNFLSDLSRFHFKKIAPSPVIDLQKPYYKAVSEVEAYYGNGANKKRCLLFYLWYCKTKGRKPCCSIAMKHGMADRGPRVYHEMSNQSWPC